MGMHVQFRKPTSDFRGTHLKLKRSNSISPCVLYVDPSSVPFAMWIWMGWAKLKCATCGSSISTLPKISRGAISKVNFADFGIWRQKWIKATWEVAHWSHSFQQFMRVKSRVDLQCTAKLAVGVRAKVTVHVFNSGNPECCCPDRQALPLLSWIDFWMPFQLK